MNNRIMNHPVLGKLEKEAAFTFTFDGKEYQSYEGDTIASALLAGGVRTLRVHENSASPRGIYCNIGHCMECRVTVNDTPSVRACLTEVKPDMVVESGKPKAAPFTDRENMPHTYTEFEQKSKRKAGNNHV